MKTEFKLITPELAKQMLSFNTINRALRDRDVAEYARLMATGLWKEETGESIQIAIDGTLINGQHRLNALIKADVCLKFLIVYDLDKTVFNVVDSGIKRSGGDALHSLNVMDSSTKASAIKRYFMLKTDIKTNLKRKASGLSNQEICFLYNKRGAFWDAATSMGSLWYKKSGCILAKSEFIAIYSYFFDINEDHAYEFMDKISSGENLQKNNPILLLREKLVYAKVSRQFSLLPSTRTALVIKAWNHFRSGNEIKVLKFDPERDKFPIAV
jgi:hypothetical protein